MSDKDKALEQYIKDKQKALREAQRRFNECLERHNVNGFYVDVNGHQVAMKYTSGESYGYKNSALLKALDE